MCNVYIKLLFSKHQFFVNIRYVVDQTSDQEKAVYEYWHFLLRAVIVKEHSKKQFEKRCIDFIYYSHETEQSPSLAF